MLRRVLVVVGLLLAVLAVPGSSAVADLNLCAEKVAPVPERINASILGPDTDSWSRTPPDPTDPESARPEVDPRGVYGSLGMAGQFWAKLYSSDCFDDTRLSLSHDLATLTWGGVRTVNTWTLRIFGWATSDDLTELFTPLVIDAMTAMRESVWRPLIPLAVTVGSIWMAWQGLIKKRFTLSVQGAVWMVSALVLGMWILLAPASAIATAMLPVDIGAGMATSAASRIAAQDVALDCPGGAGRVITQMEGESTQDLHSRETREMLWVAFSCRPWQAGVFGADRAGQEAAELYGYDVLRAQSIGTDAPQSHVEDRQQEFEEMAEVIEEEHPEVWPMFRGSLGEARLGIAGSALAGSTLGGGLILLASLALATFKTAFLVGALFSPLFLGLGIAPGPGRRLLGHYGSIMAGLLLMQVALLFIIGVLLLCYSLVFSQDLTFGEQVIALLCLLLGFLAFFAPLWRIIRARGREGRGDDPGTPSVGAPAPLAALTRRSADTWRWRSHQWGQRKAAQLDRKLAASGGGPGAAGAPGRVAAPAAAGPGGGQGAGGEDSGRTPPPLGQDQEQRTQRLARGQGAVRPEVPRDRDESAGYRGADRAAESAPAAVPERTAEEQRQEVEVLRTVRTAESGGRSEPRRDPAAAPPVPVRSSSADNGGGGGGGAGRPAAERGPVRAPAERAPVVPPTPAPDPARPPTRTRGGREERP